jgi:hypothetical protein
MYSTEVGENRKFGELRIRDAKGVMPATDPRAA